MQNNAAVDFVYISIAAPNVEHIEPKNYGIERPMRTKALHYSPDAKRSDEVIRRSGEGIASM